VQLIQLKDEMDDCVQKQDFQQAASLKLRITELEISRQTLVNDSQPQTTEVRTEKVGSFSFISAFVVTSAKRIMRSLIRLIYTDAS